MKKRYKWIGLIILAVFLFSCTLTSAGNPVNKEETSESTESNQPEPRPSATTRPAATATASPIQLVPPV